jgi:hypothetical protein
MNHEPEQEEGNNDIFERSPISRRQFVRMSTVTAGAVALPGNAFAATSSSKLTDEYEYVLNHTEEREAIPTLVTFSDESGLSEVTDMDLPLEAKTTTEPTVASHAYLTNEQVEQLLDVESVSELQFSPGSNPFWLLDYYPQGVFPPAHDSVDYIDFEQLSSGMKHLEEQYSDQLRFQSVGNSPGHYNFFKEEEDPKDIWVAEVTNNITDQDSFKEKEKIIVSQSIHGDERGGVEAGTRFAENILTGEESTVANLLDELVLIFIYTNPDGWVGRYPQYNDRSEGYSRHSAGTTRFTDEPLDPNRNYPTIGWIDATHYPADPNGLNLDDDSSGIDQDTAAGYTDNAIGSLSLVEFLRGYENLEYSFDLHGMYSNEYFILNLVMNDEYTHRELADIYEYNRTVDARLDENLGPLLEENDNLFDELQSEEYFGEDATIPTSAHSYGTVYDTIGYSTTGTFASWMAQPIEEGGLGTKAFSPEMVFNNVPTPTTFAVPDDFDVANLVELWVTGYSTMLRTIVEHASHESRYVLKTNNRSTAIVTTDSLARSSGQLSFIERDDLEVSSPEDGILTGSVDAEDEGRTVQSPNPEEILGYEQREYEVTPFNFFEGLQTHTEEGTQPFVRLSADEVNSGELLSNDGEISYDNLVVIDDNFASDQAFLDAVDDYVEAGGNLVLTDSGVALLGELENDLAAGINSDDITTTQQTFALFEEDNYPHRLLTDTRPFSQQPWKLAPLGYGINPDEGEAPISLVEQDAFEAAGGRIASTTSDQVAVGSLYPESDSDAGTGIDVIGSLLPPASQVHLHPFGMADYTVSFFGLLIMTNSLQYSHYWYRDGELAGAIGVGSETDDEDDIYQGPGDDDDGDNVDNDSDGHIDEDDEDKDDDDDRDGNNRDDDGDGAIDEDDDRDQ